MIGALVELTVIAGDVDPSYAACRLPIPTPVAPATPVAPVGPVAPPGEPAGPT